MRESKVRRQCRRGEHMPMEDVLFWVEFLFEPSKREHHRARLHHTRIRDEPCLCTDFVRSSFHPFSLNKSISSACLIELVCFL